MGDGGMARKRFTTESIIGMLREAEVRLGWGRSPSCGASRPPPNADIYVAKGQQRIYALLYNVLCLMVGYGRGCCSCARFLMSWHPFAAHRRAAASGHAAHHG